MLGKDQRNDIVNRHDARAGKTPGDIVDREGVVDVGPQPDQIPGRENLVEKRRKSLILFIEPSHREGPEV